MTRRRRATRDGVTPLGPPTAGRPRRAGLELPRKRDRTVAQIVTAWRRLTKPAAGGKVAGIAGGAKTVVGCSGGADSSALVLALAAAGAEIVVAHIVHDQRSRSEAEADRDAVRLLAERLGLPFAEGVARAKGAPGNVEATLRRGRYAELVRMAQEYGCGFIATAHHAHDQVESVLMALLRGAGTRGLRGIAPSQRLPGAKVRVIRPMLAVEPAEARRICTEAGWAWREDKTNADTSRLRARLRHEVLPALLTARPGAAQRVCEVAAAMRDADRVIGTAAGAIWSSREGRTDERGRLCSLSWERAVVTGAPRAVGGLVLLRAARALGARADRISRRQVVSALRALKRGERLTIDWAGVQVASLGHSVEVRKTRRG